MQMTGHNALVSIFQEKLIFMVFQWLTQGTQFLGNVTEVNTICASKQTKVSQGNEIKPLQMLSTRD